MKTLQERFKKMLEQKQCTISSAARSTDLSAATIHLWLNEKYKGNVEKISKAVEQFIEREELRANNIDIPFVETSVAQDVYEIANTCHIESEIGVCCGYAGLGKTYAVKMYALEHTDVILIEADFGYTPKVLFSEIHKKLGFEGTGALHNMVVDIVDKLKNSGRLIIIDEAENLPYRALELLRRIYDKAKVGILLVGMPKLLKNLKGDKGQYTQLYSRVGVLAELKPIVDNDILNIASKITPNSVSIYSKLSAFSGGNTRVLTKLLVRASRIATLNNTTIDEDVLNAALSQLLWSQE